jgi:kinase-associated protein B
MVKRYEQEIPNYIDSLSNAVENMKQELEETPSPWADKCLEIIESLEKDYFK